MQTILGAGGVIGVELARLLQSYTNKIRLISRNPKKVNPCDELFPCSLTDADKLNESLSGSVGLFNPIMKEMYEMLYQYDRDYIFDSSKFNRKYDFKPTPYEKAIQLIIEKDNP